MCSCLFVFNYLGQKIIIVTALHDKEPLNGSLQLNKREEKIVYINNYLRDLDNLPEGCFERSGKAKEVQFNGELFNGTQAEYRQLVERELDTRQINLSDGTLDSIKETLMKAKLECAQSI